MQEEVARAGGFRPMNATFGEVFDDLYNPFEDTELRLAPSATPSGDPSSKMCFKETEIYDKCPQLIPPPKPQVPKDGKYTVCTTYAATTGDGYTQKFGDIPHEGGFSPLVPSNKLEPMHFGTPPIVGALQIAKTPDLRISREKLSMSMPQRVARSIASVRFRNMEHLAGPAGVMYSTAAFDVPKGATDKLTRADEAGLRKNASTGSKMLRSMVSSNAAYTETQASYWLPPGTVVNGKAVAHKSTLSNIVLKKRVTIATDHVARYTSAVTAMLPFRSVRISAPRWILRKEFNRVFGYDSGVHRWVPIPATVTEMPVTRYPAVIISTPNGKSAIGIRAIDGPKPSTFGSRFPHRLSYFVSRAPGGTPVAVVQTLGSRGGNPGGVMAPSGTYSITTDLAFGTLKEVQAIENKVIVPSGKKCPPINAMSQAGRGVVQVRGRVFKVDNKNVARMSYAVLGRKKNLIYKKANHGLKVGSMAMITVEIATGRVIHVTYGGKAPPRGFVYDELMRIQSTLPKGRIVVRGVVTGSKPGQLTVRFWLAGKIRTVMYKRVGQLPIKRGTRVYVVVNKVTGEVLRIVLPSRRASEILAGYVNGFGESFGPGPVRMPKGTAIGVIQKKVTKTAKKGSFDGYHISYTFGGKARTFGYKTASKALVIGRRVMLYVDAKGNVTRVAAMPTMPREIAPAKSVVTGTVVSKMAGNKKGFKIAYRFGNKDMSYGFRTKKKMKLQSKVRLTLDARGGVLKVDKISVVDDILPATVVTGIVKFRLPVPKIPGAIGGYQIAYKFGKKPMTYDFETVRKINIGTKVALTLDAAGKVLKVGNTRVETDDCPSDFPVIGKGPKNKGKCCKTAWSNKCEKKPSKAKKVVDDKKGGKKKCPADFPVIGKGPKNKGKCCKTAYSNKCEGWKPWTRPSDGGGGGGGKKKKKCPSDFPVIGKGPNNKGKCCQTAYSNKCEGWKPWTRPSRRPSGGRGGGGGGASFKPDTKPVGGKCPHSFQTMGADGKCRGCPSDRPHWYDNNCQKCPKGESWTAGQACCPYKLPYYYGGKCQANVNASVIRPVDKPKGGMFELLPGSNPVRSLNTGAYCTGGNQCKSGLCSKEKRCYDKPAGCPKYTSWHAPTKKCLWPCGSGKYRGDDGVCRPTMGSASGGM